MIALLRSELYRIATVPANWISIAIFGVLGLLLGFFSADMWGLLAGMGTLVLAALAVCQHYQHRTVILLHLARPRRIVVLAIQVLTAVTVTLGFVAVSGVTVLIQGDSDQYGNTLLVVPVLAILGVAGATIVRRSTILFVGCSVWLLFVEGLIFKLKGPLPFSAYLEAATGDRMALLILTSWTALALSGAVIAIRRDLAGD
jgi:hypothetical protein